MRGSQLHGLETFGEQLSGVVAELGKQECDTAPLLGAGS